MEILDFLSNQIYCSVLMELVTFIALIVSIRYYKRHPQLRIFTYYILFSLLDDLANTWEQTTKQVGHYTTVGIRVVDSVFIIFEFLIFSLFILHYVRGRSGRLAIKIVILLFFSMFLWVSIINVKNFYIGLDTRYMIAESILLVFPCLIYYYGLFVNVSPNPLSEDPSFWVVTGFFFLNACSIPMILTFAWLGRFAHIVFSLNYLLYIILFILLIRAYRCRPSKHLAV
jgi:hypothetical protein